MISRGAGRIDRQQRVMTAAMVARSLKTGTMMEIRSDIIDRARGRYQRSGCEPRGRWPAIIAQPQAP